MDKMELHACRQCHAVIPASKEKVHDRWHRDRDHAISRMIDEAIVTERKRTEREFQRR